MSQFDKPEFKKLRDEYYKKLEDSGFEDIEKDKSHDLCIHKLMKRMSFKMDTFEPIRDYYTWATHALQWAVFESRSDEMIWILHSEGKSSREISISVEFDQTHVCRRIKKIRNYISVQEPTK